MSIRVEKPKTVSYWKPLSVVLVIAAGLYLWPHFAPRPYTPLAFEIVGFEGDVQIYDLQSRSWRVPKRGEEFVTSQRLKTGADGVINFQVENQIMLRLKENSELLNKECRALEQKDIYKLHLKSGVLLGATTKEFDRKVISGKAIFFVITTPYSTVTPSGAVFRIVAGRNPDEDRVGVLRGSVEIAPSSLLFPKHGVRIRGLEMAGLVGGAVQTPTRVTTEEWQEMKEAYELLKKSAAMEAEQINLSKLAGSFFNVVFDHGTFFTPKMGYSGREFFRDPDSGEVLLETEYDVFPDGSFVGVYIKTRDFDISKYTGLSFEIRRKGEEGVPESFFIELKSKGNVVRRYAPRTFERTWKRVEFDFHAPKPTAVNEVVFVFTNVRVGEAKKGMLEFRNIELIPLPEVTAAAPQAEATATAPQAEVIATASQTEAIATVPKVEVTATVPQDVVQATPVPQPQPAVKRAIPLYVLPRSSSQPAGNQTISLFAEPQAVAVSSSQSVVDQPMPSSVAPQAPAPATDSSLSVPKEVSLE